MNRRVTLIARDDVRALRNRFQKSQRVIGDFARALPVHQVSHAGDFYYGAVVYMLLGVRRASRDIKMS